MNEVRDKRGLSESRIPGFVRLFVWTLILAGPAIFFHELGHFVAGLAFGEDVQMT